MGADTDDSDGARLAGHGDPLDRRALLRPFRGIRCDRREGPGGQGALCRGSGAYTQPRNGKGDAYACKRCRPGAIERRWTRELVISAMLDWRERYGRMPSSYDWSRTHARRRGQDASQRLAAGQWPSASIVSALFGTWTAAREAAAAARRPAAKRLLSNRITADHAIERGIEPSSLYLKRRRNRARRSEIGDVVTDLLKPGEVARRLQVSRTWLYAAAKAGRIPSVRLGGADGPVRFVEEDIEQWLERARQAWRPGESSAQTLRRARRAA